MASIRITKSTVLSAAAGAMTLAFIGSVAEAAPVAGALPVLKAEAATNSQVEQARHGGSHYGWGSGFRRHYGWGGGFRRHYGWGWRGRKFR
jgi:hypothetical protein